MTLPVQTAPLRRLTAFLDSNGPCLSSDAINYLVKTGMTPVNARKLIQRSGGTVLRLFKIRFPHNQQFLFLASQYKKQVFWESLINAFDATNSVYGHAVNSLVARDGIWPTPFFGVISGSPEKLSKHIGSTTLLKKLTDIELIETIEHPDLGTCAKLVDEAFVQLRDRGKALRSRIVVEEILLRGLGEWLRNTGLGSWNKVLTRDLRNPPSFGQFKWDFTTPTFVYPIRTSSKTPGPFNGFVVGDVLLGREIEEKDLQYFIVKTDIMRSQRRTRPFLAIFVADRYRTAALKAGRSRGLLLVTAETLFGREVASGLSQLIQVLQNAAAAVASDPSIVSELFRKLDGMIGATLNIRGSLFELLAAHLLKEDAWSITSIGELRRDPYSGGLAEVDVLAVKGSHVMALECKGYITNEVSEEEVKKWLTETVPRIRGSLSTDRFYQQKGSFTFEFWTASKFSAEALKFLEEKKQEIKKFSFSWLDGPALLKFSKTSKNEYASRILREQYQL